MMDDQKNGLIKALKKDGMLLNEIPKREQTVEICKAAIKQNPLALKFSSRKFIDAKLCLSAVKKDGRAFQYVPEKFITKSMCELAVLTDPALFRKVPEIFRYELFNEETETELIEKIASVNANWLMYMPNRMDVRNLWIQYMDQDFSIVQNMPESVRASDDILTHQKSIGKLQLQEKWFDSFDRKFKIEIKVEFTPRCPSWDNDFIDEDYYTVTFECEQFEKFYEFLDGDLFDAELEDYDFFGIDLKNYNIEGAVINSEVLAEHGLYDGTYFSIVKMHMKELECEEVFENNEIIISDEYYYPKPVDEENHEKFDFDHIPFFYISDIHLTHRICNHYKNMATKDEIRSYIKKLARDIVASIGTKPYGSYLFVVGDTSSIFDFNSIFYNELRKLWGEKIIVVAGNHELLDPWVDLEENIKIYRSFFEKLGIIFLQNDLFYLERDKPKNNIIYESELLNINGKKLTKLLQYSSFAVLGGIGFSGLNPKYNASNLRYGKSFDELTREEALQRDVSEANRFNVIYSKLLKSLYKNRVIILTHTPKDDWTTERYNPGWIYLNGHNHRNYSEVGKERVIYADNQIGYKSKHVGLKYFYCDNDYDIFAYYKDGIYEITKEQYLDFNRGKLINMSFNRNNGEIYMLKRNDIYMFMIYCKYTDRSMFKTLYLLNGGKLLKLERVNLADTDYYYRKLLKYSDNVNLLLTKYVGAQRRISDFIKQLGGSGNIHGCIVDIDKPGESGFSYCHLYVNPIDGKVTPYFAFDTGARFVYKDLKTLLLSQDECKTLAKKYLEFEKKSKKNLPALQYPEQEDEWHGLDRIFDVGSYIYKISRVIRSLQYCFEQNVVRYWNEDLLNYDFVTYINQADQLSDLADDRLIFDE